MNIEHAGYLPWIVLALATFIITLVVLERKFFGMVKLYWFYRRSLLSYLSSFLLVGGMALLLTSLLDWRGPEEKIKAGVPTERTIILIDTSASMLAEDVKPSRLQKAVLVAKHFARKAAGHQLSIVAFAEIQKKIVPFTNDLDLIDARLDSIKNLRNQNGSSALTVAIQESVQYFKETGEPRGNILLLTDGEETAEDINLKLPKEVHLALVGVGTKQGGRIPLDDGRGFRFGYKKNRGQDIITKLNESFFQKVAADVPSGKYWLANTYSLPTDEILDFFKGEKQKGESQQDMVIKPVMMEWIVVPGLILMTLAYLLKCLRIFALMLALTILPVQAAGEQEPEITPQIQQKLEMLQKGNLNQLEKIKLADDLQKAGAKSEALALYDENLPIDKIDPKIPAEAYLNYGTALLEKGEEQKGLAVYDALGSSLGDGSPKAHALNEMMDKNVVNYFKVQEQKKQQQKKEQDQQKKDQDKQQQSSGGGSDQDQSSQPQQSKDQKNKDQKNQDPKDKKDQKGDEKKDDEDQQGDENKEDQKKKQDQPKEGEEPPKQKPQKKLPAKLKQLMSDDRQLQMKIIEQDTRDMNRRKSRENKDW